MMRGIIENLSLWTCVWQSTTFVLLGLVGAHCLRKHPARAYQVLLLTMIACVAVPTGTALVKHLDLGIFAAQSGETPLDEHAVGPVSVRALPAFMLTELGLPRVPPSDADTMATSALSQQADISWHFIFTYAWITATLLLMTRLVLAFLSGAWWTHRACTEGCEAIQEAADQARANLGIGRILKVRWHGRIHSPVIWCWTRRPVLLVPSPSESRANHID